MRESIPRSQVSSEVVIEFNGSNLRVLCDVRGAGFEPARLSARAFKAPTATVTSPTRRGVTVACGAEHSARGAAAHQRRTGSGCAAGPGGAAFARRVGLEAREIHAIVFGRLAAGRRLAA